MAQPKGYFELSSDTANSLILIAPLLLAYEVGLLLSNFAGLNGVDFMTIFVVQQFGVRGLLVGNLVVLLAIAGAAHFRTRERTFDPAIAPLVAMESTVYALLLGFTIVSIMHHLPFNPAAQTGGGVAHAVIASLGAGVNEELVFRALLFNGLVLAFSRGVEKPGGGAVFAALLVSSVLFSLAHYLGPEAFQLYSFVYRILAGAIFCGLYLARGLAVAVYTHAIYDIIVLTARA